MTTLSCPRQQQQQQGRTQCRGRQAWSGQTATAADTVHWHHCCCTLDIGQCTLTLWDYSVFSLFSAACYPVNLLSSSSESLLWCDQEQYRSQHLGQGSISVPGTDVEMWRPSARCLTKERIAAASTKIIDPNSVPFLPQLYFLPSLLVSTFSINKKKLRNRIFPLFSQI